MRIALFTDTYEPEVNGVARTLKRWVSYLENRGVACKVFAPSAEPDDRTAQGPHSVTRFASLPFFMYPECRLALPNPLFVKKAIQSFKPTLIHVATPFNIGLCGLYAAKKFNLPLIASYHTNFDRYLPFYNLQWMEKLLWRYLEWFHHDCSRILVPTRPVKEELVARGWDEKRLSIWRRGIDPSRYHPRVQREAWLQRHGLDPDTFVVLYAGRMAPEKQVDVAIKAFSLFQRRCPSRTALVLAGDGPTASTMKELAEQEGIAAYFAGLVQPDDMQRWYAAADLFLFPSSTETFGNVVLESMACGTPVLCADQGGVTDIVVHGHTGLMCEAGSDESFADALELAYRDLPLRRRLAAAGLNYSRRQTWEAIFDQLFESCIELSGSEYSSSGHIAN
ncbi:glycosyltransferase family 4 protein [Paenibacillus thailandensis]|uniref:Glycosyltransferase family 4 protein n=1 Tax=Paenibacillus thailandensis TaxID=393250 RepID=A0ABW5QWK8_9BACL